MGKMSRDKGARSERQLRDELLRQGWTDVVRVPLSGAVKSRNAYQDDVVGVAPDGKEYRFENKARAAGFDPIYGLIGYYDGRVACSFTDSKEMLLISLDPNAVLENLHHMDVTHFPDAHQKVLRSVAKKCRDWIGNAEILSLKQDRKPFIYCRYRR